MRRIWMTALTAGLILVPATLAAQHPGPHGPRAAHAQLVANPAARVLALRTVFELTPAQVTQLEQIRDRAAAQNRPLLEQLQALRPARPDPARLRGQQSPEQRAQMQARREEMRQQREQLSPEQRRAQMQERREQMQAHREQLQPIVTQLRQNAENTRREVESVLSSAQLAKLRELEAARPQRGERGAFGARGPRGPRPAR